MKKIKFIQVLVFSLFVYSCTDKDFINIPNEIKAADQIVMAQIVEDKGALTVEVIEVIRSKKNGYSKGDKLPRLNFRGIVLGDEWLVFYRVEKNGKRYVSSAALLEEGVLKSNPNFSLDKIRAMASEE